MRLGRSRPEGHRYVQGLERGLALVRVLGIRFMNDEDVGQAALDIEMSVLIQGYPPRDRMTH